MIPTATRNNETARRRGRMRPYLSTFVLLVLVLGCCWTTPIVTGFVHKNQAQQRPQQPTTVLSAVQVDDRKRTRPNQQYQGEDRTPFHSDEDEQQRRRQRQSADQESTASQLDELLQLTPSSTRESPVNVEVEIRCQGDADEDEDEETAEEDNEEPSDDRDDETSCSRDNADDAQERRKLAARAALLGSSRSRSTAARKPSYAKQPTSAKEATTSVGARRVGSASKASQGPGVTKRFMDAVRKSAKTKDNSTNNDSDDSTTALSSASSSMMTTKRKLSPSGIHAAVLELMERRKEEYFGVGNNNNQSSLPRPFIRDQPLALFPTKKEQRIIPANSQTPPPGTVLVPALPTTSTLPENNNRLRFPDCLTVRVATPKCDVEVANLRLSVFSDFSPEVRRQLVSRSVKAVVSRRSMGATCLIATVPPSVAARKRNRPPVILGSAECSFHEFEGTTLGYCRPTGSILYITEVAVSPTARRRGVGAKLLESIDVLASMRQIETLYLHVDVENEGALALYEKAGFQRVDKSDPMFLEFTTKLNLQDGATKGRNHFLLYKNMVTCPTWLPAPSTTTTIMTEMQGVPATVLASGFPPPGPVTGTLGFEVPC